MGADVMQKEMRSLQTLIVCNVDQLEVNASHGGQLDASNDDMRSSGSHAHSKPFRNGCTFIFSDQPKLSAHFVYSTLRSQCCCRMWNTSHGCNYKTTKNHGSEWEYVTSTHFKVIILRSVSFMGLFPMCGIWIAAK